MIYSTEERSPDVGQKPVRSEGEIDMDYILSPQVLLRNTTGW